MHVPVAELCQVKLGVSQDLTAIASNFQPAELSLEHHLSIGLSTLEKQ
jgi:hypothetical protein